MKLIYSVGVLVFCFGCQTSWRDPVGYIGPTSRPLPISHSLEEHFAPGSKNVYVMGAVNQSGIYRLPEASELTLIQLLAGAVVIRGHVDILSSREVTVLRVNSEQPHAYHRSDRNLYALFKGTQSDIYLKPGDLIVVSYASNSDSQPRKND